LDHLDGLIVTGTEPRAQSLAEEPYWAVLAKTVDWACEHVSSVFWSCLAAHAAVLHLDGIERCPRPTKLFGTFASTKVAEHFLLAELPTDIWCAPHSRWNDLPEAALMACGYQVIARSPGAGVDMFIKHVSRSLFVFMQSHLEYDARALMREYRRDVLRYLTGERDLYPELPEGYFDPATEWELELLREDAMRTRTPDIMPIMQQAIGRANLTGAWRPKAIQFYRNWLAALGAVSPSLALSA
jgi:homoserine O-succinyltransferase